MGGHGSGVGSGAGDGAPAGDVPGPDDEQEPFAALPAYRIPARRAASLYLLVAAALVPWTIYLAVSLPQRDLERHYRLAWVGFDVLLVVVIVLTGWFAFRVDPRVQMPATATATLLVVDAWFDVLTSPDRAAVVVAVAFALFLELPGAVLSLLVAARVSGEVGRLAEEQLADEEAPAA